MKFLKVWQKDQVDGKSRFDIDETEETFNSVYFSYYAPNNKKIKVYEMSPNIFEVYCKNEDTIMLVCDFLRTIGYNDSIWSIDKTPVSTNYIHINLAQRLAILTNTERPIRDFPINWEDPVNRIYAYRDVSNIKANVIKVYFINYDTAKRWLSALQLIGYSCTDTRIE